MILPWFVLIIEILLFFPFKSLTNNPEAAAVLIMIVNIPFVLIPLYRYGKETFLFLLTGFFMRILFMFWDVYGKSIFPLPHSGNDSEGFLKSALRISENLSLLEGDIYGGLYSKVMGIILYFGPESRILLQYINVILGIITILLIYKTMTLLKVGSKIKKSMLTIMILFPSSLIFSSILLREAIIAYTVVLSFYFFLHWILKGKPRYIVFSFSVLLISALFHSGVLGILIGYIFMMLFYKPNIKIFQLSFQSVSVFIAIIIGIFILSLVPLENLPFLDKFTHALEKEDDIYDVATGGRGGSVYLSNLHITNPLDLILFSPVKMIFFLMSPLPIDWRGLFDIVSFLYDGLIYGILFLYPVFNYKKIIKGDPVAISLFVTLLGVIFIFGIALNNAGTAMRHRYKIFYLIILFFAITLKNRKNTEKR